jgi:transmembrane sensor
LATVCAIGVSAWLYDRLQPDYATVTGEQKWIQLADGSSVELNSRSRIRVRFSEHQRDVDLLEGQALFHVAKDPSRPFVVYGGSVRVRAVGTQFDVYRKAADVTVTVVEGRVAVLPTQRGELAAAQSSTEGAPGSRDATAANAITLVAGEQVTVSPSVPAQPVRANVNIATAWTQHELVFDSTPLPDVAREFNRYNLRQLVVDDTELKDFHVTGVFSSADPASLLRFLRAQRGLKVAEMDREIHISRK